MQNAMMQTSASMSSLFSAYVGIVTTTVKLFELWDKVQSYIQDPQNTCSYDISGILKALGDIKDTDEFVPAPSLWSAFDGLSKQKLWGKVVDLLHPQGTTSGTAGAPANTGGAKTDAAGQGKLYY